MPSLGAPELLIIALIVIFLFGGKKLAELGTGLGKGIKNFKDAMRDGEGAASSPKPPAPPAPPSPPAQNP